jgi:hypothetical protein
MVGNLFGFVFKGSVLLKKKNVYTAGDMALSFVYVHAPYCLLRVMVRL